MFAVKRSLQKYKKNINVYEIKDEITPKNRICTLEQAEVYVKAVENFMEDMKKPESAKDNRPIYRTHNEEYVRGSEMLRILSK